GRRANGAARTVPSGRRAFPALVRRRGVAVLPVPDSPALPTQPRHRSGPAVSRPSRLSTRTARANGGFDVAVRQSWNTNGPTFQKNRRSPAAVAHSIAGGDHRRV